ncbi:Dethiobiotin synthetase, partial [filamentous cyanobacterium CCP5]
HQEPALDREIIHALFNLSYESQRYFDAGQRSGVVWPPMLADDLRRIAAGVRGILTNQPPESRA